MVLPMSTWILGDTKLTNLPSIWEWRQNNWRFTHDPSYSLPGGSVPDRDLWELLDYIVRQYELIEYVVSESDGMRHVVVTVVSGTSLAMPIMRRSNLLKLARYVCRQLPLGLLTLT